MYLASPVFRIGRGDVREAWHSHARLHPLDAFPSFFPYAKAFHFTSEHSRTRPLSLMLPPPPPPSVTPSLLPRSCFPHSWQRFLICFERPHWTPFLLLKRCERMTAPPRPPHSPPFPPPRTLSHPPHCGSTSCLDFPPQPSFWIWLPSCTRGTHPPPPGLFFLVSFNSPTNRSCASPRLEGRPKLAPFIFFFLFFGPYPLIIFLF